MIEFIEFLEGVMPGLYRLAASMFDAYDGSVPRAQADISDRKDQIDALRKARDVDLERKYPSHD